MVTAWADEPTSVATFAARSSGLRFLPEVRLRPLPDALRTFGRCLEGPRCVPELVSGLLLRRTSSSHCVAKFLLVQCSLPATRLRVEDNALLDLVATRNWAEGCDGQSRPIVLAIE